MTFQQKISLWRGLPEDEKQRLSVAMAVGITAIIFLLWLAVTAFDLSQPTPSAPVVTAPTAVQIVSAEPGAPWWRKLSATIGDVGGSIWEGIMVIADKLKM